MWLGCCTLKEPALRSGFFFCALNGHKANQSHTMTAPIIFQSLRKWKSKGDDDLDSISRLICLGIRPDCAVDTVNWFLNRGDNEGLEQYIENIRARKVEVSER